MHHMGDVATFMGFVPNPTQFYWLRYLLGGRGGGLLSRDHRLPVALVSRRGIDRARKSLFLIAQPISQALGLPLSRLILENVDWLGLSGWRWVFILEGAPSIVMGVITLFYLTDWPRDARWLPEDQKQWLTAEIERERSAKEAQGRAGGWTAFREPQILLLVAIYFFVVAGNQSIIFFLPSITEAMSSLSVTMRTIVTMLPYVCSFFGILLNGHLTSRAKRRRWYVAMPILFTGVSLAGAVMSLGHPVPMVLFFCLAGFTAQAYLPAFWTVPSTVLTKSGAAVAVGLINSVGSLGGMAGPYMFGYLKTATGEFQAGLWCLVASLVISGLLATRIRV
jgi:ACS family tartrate transporter-like MFS transporter